MVKIRLKRLGRHKLSVYRIVVADSHFPRDGRFIELIGTYDPNANPPAVKIDETLALKWLNQGAKPTDTVRTLLSSQGIIQKFNELKK